LVTESEVRQEELLGLSAVPTSAEPRPATSQSPTQGNAAEKPKTLTSAMSPSPDTGSDAFESRLAAARLQERRGDEQQAERVYQALIEANPRHPGPHHRLGVLAARQGKLSEAKEHFRTAVGLAPPSTDLLSDVGYWLYLQGRFEEAEQVLRRALAQEPTHEAANNNLGLTLGEQGRYQESLALFKQSASDGEALTNLAYVCAQRGDYDRALAYYSRALTLEPNLRPAAQAMVQIAQQKPVPEKPTAAAEGTPTPRSASQTQAIRRQPPTLPAANHTVNTQRPTWRPDR
jgi:Tfp pilus assembly protein PilF